MNTKQFIQNLMSSFPFSEEDEYFAFVDVPSEKILAFDKRIEIRAINYLPIENAIVGLSLSRILDLESGNELILVEGSETKDGLYYLDHESELITIEELEDEDDALTFIESVCRLSAEQYMALSPDQKVEVLERYGELRFVVHTLDAFYEQVEMIQKEDFYKR